jgi:creatinine amidohydrolase
MYETLGAGRSDWAGKPYPEIVETAEADGSILVIPVGSIEQHGHHLPVATDTILVDAVAHLGADRVASDLPLLVTPTVWSGYSPHHMPFGGTITVAYRTLLSILEDAADAALDNGFDAILFLNGHGGNASLISSAVSTVGVEHPSAQVLGLTYFDLARSFADEIRDSDVGGMAHGGEFETSLMAYLRPEFVGEGDAEYWHEPYDHGGKDLLEGGPLSVYRTFDEYSETGAIGDPALASAEKGEAIYDLLGDELEHILRAIHEQNR